MVQFATTRWSLILNARAPGVRDGSDAARAALEEICRAYRAPVLAYIRGSGRSRPDAEDLTQEFFTRLLERRWDATADPARGRFRTFLLTAVRHFLADVHDTEHARKRGGDCRRVDWDAAADGLVAPASESPERAFERAWAATVIEHAYARLRDEADRAGKRTLFERLAPFLAEPPDAADYPLLGEELSLRPNTIAVSVRRLRLRLRELVREEIAEQTDSADAMETELRALRNALLVDSDRTGDRHVARQPD